MMNRQMIKTACLSFGAICMGGGFYIGYLVFQTHAHIDRLHASARAIGRAHASTTAEEAVLPAPVQRYLDYVFQGREKPAAYVELEMEGDFRRPLLDKFERTTAKQTLVSNTPAMVFEATTPILPGISATAYDAYLDGEMEMKAKLMSFITVVDEKSSDVLDRISLRRWLMEAPLFPHALRPSRYLQWEPIDDMHARAVANYKGMQANLIATFAADGRLISWHAEGDGDLTTPYHGSGEFVARSDYRDVDGVMIPFSFSVARMAGGRKYPFWTGQITDYRIQYQTLH